MAYLIKKVGTKLDRSESPYTTGQKKKRNRPEDKPHQLKDPLDWERRLFRKFEEWTKSPSTLYEDDIEMLFVAKIIGVKEQKIIDLITKNKKNFEEKIYDVSAHPFEKYEEDDYNYLPELKDRNGKICVIASAHHMLLYSEKRKKFVSCLSGISWGFDDNISPYKWIDNQYDDADVESIKKVAKELGYMK